MHKAKLFLLAVFSLTMLLPLGNDMNKSSNAMALTEDLYPDLTKVGVDYSQYDRFYKDDNFRENYYNYHKQQHQYQPQQSSYDNINNDKYGTEKTVQYVNDMADYVEDKYLPYANDKYVKSQNSEFVKKIKCNNINVNVNGLELDLFPPFLADNSGIAAESVEDNTDENSFAGNNGYGSEINDFRFICINNNNNTIIEAEPPIPEQITCEECFINNLNDTQLQDFEDALERSGFTLESFCEFLSNPEISNEQKSIDLVDLLVDAGIFGDDQVPIIDCLEASGIFDFANMGA
jgi:hypothetical protein